MKQSSSGSTASPYLNARREWDERYGDALSRAYSWRIVALAACGVAALAVAGVGYIGAQSKIQPFVVAIDTLGNPIAIGKPTTGGEVSERIIISQVANWIWNARTVLADPDAQKILLDNVYSFSNGDTAAYLNSYYKQHSPFSDDGTVTRVNVTSVLPVSQNTYQITWAENTQQPGKPEITKNWKAEVTVGINSKITENPKIMISNPLGIYIKSLSWTQVLS